MKVSDESVWRKWRESNTDPYGAGVIRYAERWADLMEERLSDGGRVQDVAAPTSVDADTEGITGFMYGFTYGMAVSVLASCWAHGEELRRWHNLDTQIADEGERANEARGVLNPAVLNIGGAP